MPVRNIKEAETLSPLGEHLAEMAHLGIKEELYIGDICEDRPNAHEGLRYVATDECFECNFKKVHGIEPLLGLRTFLGYDCKPTHYKKFIGKFAPWDYEAYDVFFGKTCSRCQTNLRYHEGRLCVFCAGMRMAELEGPEAMKQWTKQATHPIPMTNTWDRFLRAVAAFDGLPTYEGKVCGKHANSTRYTSRGQCTMCVSYLNKGYQDKKKTAPEKTEAAGGEFDNLFD